jgi:hypothetical protein
LESFEIAELSKKKKIHLPFLINYTGRSVRIRMHCRENYRIKCQLKSAEMPGRN